MRPEPLVVRWQDGKRCGDSRTAVGCTHSQTVVSVWRGVSERMLDAVVLHELGHVLGAGHVPPGKGIMSAKIDEAARRITETDRAVVCP
jgi:predicted HD phosphohydrolase